MVNYIQIILYIHKKININMNYIIYIQIKQYINKIINIYTNIFKY